MFNHNNGLDGFYFAGEYCENPADPSCGTEGIVTDPFIAGEVAEPPFASVIRVYLAGGTGTMYIAEGHAVAAPVPVPAAGWLLGSALGLAGFLRHRRNKA